MVVAVITVRVVQATADKVIDVIAVRHALVSTGWAMYVTCAALPWSALRRICGARLDDMLVDVVSVRMMQVPIMQVVDMIAVTDGSMTASRTMLMRMVGVCGVRAGRHDRPPLSYSHSSGRATVDADGYQEFESKEKLADHAYCFASTHVVRRTGAERDTVDGRAISTTIRDGSPSRPPSFRHFKQNVTAADPSLSQENPAALSG